MSPVLQNLPAALTLSRIGCGIGVLLALLARQDRLALGLYVAGAVTDALDGAVARRWRCASARGSLLDAVADRIFFLLVIVGLGISGKLTPFIHCAACLWIPGEMIVGACITRKTGRFYLYAPHRQSIRLTACLVFLGLGWSLLKWPWAEVIFALFISATIATGLDYAYWLKARQPAPSAP
ncbi:MAG: hypothetical protein PCFJNLEI_03288 [Verrucomicrobiae bacterium]|nr:hypothetical protein [Verrucomicrobiae bacterium]